MGCHSAMWLTTCNSAATTNNDRHGVTNLRTIRLEAFTELWGGSWYSSWGNDLGKFSTIIFSEGPRCRWKGWAQWHPGLYMSGKKGFSDINIVVAFSLSPQAARYWIRMSCIALGDLSPAPMLALGAWRKRKNSACSLGLG
ncbi:uncharacterized protein H6S33_011885 [Morchella sextelata]|uniref:uncharacterized protein n=1 Tax=Morchella sextelata TaxID=1174677 RepID=UPI001D0512D7|nr:uncharacterized protein H6S33_011885 [Morchella sextelata]KAH0610358.1 hypothetical protein H6S33_011885 [Morchella sextelata]